MTDAFPALKPEWVAPGRTALLVIDLQVDFAAPDGAMAQAGADIAPAQAAVAQVERLVAAARRAGVACVFSRVVTVPGAQSAVEQQARARRGGSLICVEGTPGAALVAPLPQAGELLVTKRRYSVFAGTGLEEMLGARGIDTLVFCGLTTECCVQSSAWDAFERDFHVVIAADACAAYEPALHDAALRALALNGAILAETGALLSAWEYSL